MKERLPKVIRSCFPYIVPELNVNGCMGGKAEGYLSDGYLFLFKGTGEGKTLRHLDTQNAPVFKGQDPVWNEMALALAGAGLITTKAGAKEAGKKSCLFTIKTSQGQEKVIAIPVANLAPHLTEQMAANQYSRRSRFYSAMKLYGVDIGYGFTKVAGVDRIPRVMPIYRWIERRAFLQERHRRPHKDRAAYLEWPFLSGRRGGEKIQPAPLSDL